MFFWIFIFKPKWGKLVEVSVIVLFLRPPSVNIYFYYLLLLRGLKAPIEDCVLGELDEWTQILIYELVIDRDGWKKQNKTPMPLWFRIVSMQKCSILEDHSFEIRYIVVFYYWNKLKRAWH